MPRTLRLLSNLVIIWLLSLFCVPVSAKTIAYVGEEYPSAAIKAAAQAAGFQLVNGLPTDASAADALLIATPVDPGPDSAAHLASIAKAMLLQGKSIYLFLGSQTKGALGLEPLLPVNMWNLDMDDRMRLDTGVLPPEGQSPFVDISGMNLSSRYDLHLPYALIEAGEHRYSWQTMDKDLLNTDWTVLLRSDQQGQLPLLVSGRYGPGTTFVFGASLTDPNFVQWNGYEKFLQALLTLSTPSADAVGQPGQLSVSIPQYEPNGLMVNVTNHGSASATVLLAYKIGNAEHQLLNSTTSPATIPAGKTISIPLAERSADLGEESIEDSGDKAFPYRYIHVGVATVDRQSTLVDQSGIVDVSPALTSSIEGPDLKSYGDRDRYPDRQMGSGLDGGAPISLYVVPVGTQTTLKVILRNGLHDIAPLAAAADLGWPDNPSTQGLNDLAMSEGSLRGTMPLYGFWGGRPAADQTVSLTWQNPVTIAGQTIYGFPDYRKHDLANPTGYTLSAHSATDGDKTLATLTSALYTDAVHSDNFAPVSATSCTLHITGLNPTRAGEPAFTPVGATSNQTTNAAIDEWSIFGWPTAQVPPPVSGHLTVTLTDMNSGSKSTLLDKDTALGSSQELDFPITIPAATHFGPLRVDMALSVSGSVAVSSHYDLLAVDEGHPSITPNPVSDMGLLCEPGFQVFDDFGMGTSADTGGWVGVDNGIWAVTHDLMEIGSRNVDIPSRMFTTSVRFSHYSCPWRDYPSGEYFWDWAGDKLEQMVLSNKFQGRKTLHIFLADRWNGIPVGATFTWADFIDFDQYLRKTTGHGLTGRSRKEIDTEITSHYGDVWQKWQMDRYANKLLELQQKLAKDGVTFTVTTHGGFPLAGGDLGARIAKTHIASGTDVFWDQQFQDLYHTLGLRFGIVAANPDLQSGGYNEWGWVNGGVFNSHWYGYTGAVEPSRRQWYGTYFMGRVTSAGDFQPFTVYGFDAQGSPGPKITDDDWQTYYRVQRLTSRVRPEAPAGMGVVVSWNEQVHHMGKTAGNLGTGLYAAKGYPQIDELAGDVFYKLLTNGVPVSFVASTDTLKNWQGTAPLLVADGATLDPDEIDTLIRLNRLGAPIIAIGDPTGASGKAAEFFGIDCRSGKAVPDAATSTIKNGGDVVAFVTRRPGHGAVVLCPISPTLLDGSDSEALAKVILAACGNPISVSQGITSIPFVSHSNLFLSLGSQSDLAQNATITVNPGELNSTQVSNAYRVIDLDDDTVLPSQTTGGAVSFSVPMCGSDGKMVMIEKQ